MHEVEEESEDACLLDTAQQPPYAQSTPSAGTAAASASRVDWVALLTAALLITAGVLSYYGSALQQLAAAHGSAESTTSAAPRPAAVDFQAWVLDTLQPLPPRRLHDGDPHIAVEEDGVRMYRQGGENYAMGSLSSRLQRLPLLSERWDAARRFPYNPSILERRASAAGAGLPNTVTAGSSTVRSYDYHLNTQLGSYAVYRNGSQTRYDENPWGWSVTHVLQQLTITVNDTHTFQLSFAHTQGEDSLRLGNEVRLLHHHDAVLAYDNRLDTLLFPLHAGHLVVNASQSPLRLQAWNDHHAKNLMAASVGGQVYYVQKFSPFVVVFCGAAELPTHCELYAQPSLQGSLLPQYHEHWRGSTTLLPLPAHPQLLLGLIHERTTSARDRSRDVYYHRFVLIDSDDDKSGWIPIAFTPPFGLFANVSAVHWFEYIMSLAYLGSSELVLTLGYNDQEPWLCILPLHGVIRALQPVFEWQAAELASVQAHSSYS